MWKPATCVAVGFCDAISAHYVSSRLYLMESANRREVVSQRLTVAPFQSLTQSARLLWLTICLACSDFHDCSPVSGASCPLHQTARGKVPKQRTEAKRLVRPGRNRVARWSDTGSVPVARSVLVDDRRRGDLFGRDAAISKRRKEESETSRIFRSLPNRANQRPERLVSSESFELIRRLPRKIRCGTPVLLPIAVGRGDPAKTLIMNWRRKWQKIRSLAD